MKRNIVWVVEMWNADRRKWEPTVGSGIDRFDGRQELKKWKHNNRFDKFRLRRYSAESEG